MTNERTEEVKEALNRWRSEHFIVSPGAESHRFTDPRVHQDIVLTATPSELDEYFQQKFIPLEGDELFDVEYRNIVNPTDMTPPITFRHATRISRGKRLPSSSQLQSWAPAMPRMIEGAPKSEGARPVLWSSSISDPVGTVETALAMYTSSGVFNNYSQMHVARALFVRSPTDYEIEQINESRNE